MEIWKFCKGKETLCSLETNQIFVAGKLQLNRLKGGIKCHILSNYFEVIV